MDILFEIVWYIFASIVLGWACYYVAETKGYAYKWTAAVLGFFFGTLALIVYLAIEDKNKDNKNNKQLLTD